MSKIVVIYNAILIGIHVDARDLCVVVDNYTQHVCAKIRAS